MKAQRLVGWSDLPYEVVEQIICHCDNLSLLSLAKLSRSLNYHAIQTLLSREYIDFSKGIAVKPAPYFDRVFPVIAALNLCIHITTLTYFQYRFHPSSELLLETEGIARLLDRVSAVGELSLYFETVRSAFEFKTGVALVEKRATIWRLMFETLLETALKKGCRRLAVHGGDYLKILPPFEPRPPRPPRPSPRTRSSFLEGLMAYLGGLGTRSTSPEVPVAPAPFTPSLECLELQSPMMLQPPLLTHTFKLLQNQSPVLRRLVLVNVQVDPSIWEEFFSSLNLPVLEEFTCRPLKTHTSIITVQPHILLNYFVRHSSIHKLVFLGVCIDGIEKEFPSLQHALLLPNLEYVEASPQIISWLLQHNNGFSKLKCVSLTSEDSEDDGKNLDNAILALRPRCSSNITTSPKLSHLSFAFYRPDSKLHSWLLKQTEDPLTNPFLFLTRIERLSITSWQFEQRHYGNGPYYATRNLRPGLNDPNTLLAWLSLFQGLKNLTIREWGDELEARMTEEFTAIKLKSMCPLLENCVIGNSRIIS